MPNQGKLSRRQFLATTAFGAAVTATGSISMPSVLRAQGASVKLGVLHPVTGALSYSGQQGRLGAILAIEEINAAGGVKGLGKIDAILGDAQSTPDGGVAEVEKMNSANVAALSADTPATFVWRRRKRRRATSFPMSSMSASPTELSLAASRIPLGSAPASVSFPKPRWPISLPSTSRPASRPRRL